MPRNAASTVRGLALIGLLGALALLVAACGTRVPREEVAAAAGGAMQFEQPGSVEAQPNGGGEVARGGSDAAGQTRDRSGVATDPADGARRSGETQVAPEGDSGAGGEEQQGQQRDRTQAQAEPEQEEGARGQNQASGEPASGEPIVLGNVGTYSGPAASVLGGGRIALEAWARRVNDQGGINGRPVEMIIRDDGFDVAQRNSMIRDLVENVGIDAFVFLQIPLAPGSILPYLEERQVPAVGGDLVNQIWWESPTLFPQGTELQSQSVGILTEARERAGTTKIAHLYCAEADTCQQIAERAVEDGGAADEAGVEIVYRAEVSITQPDFTAECLNARAAEAEAIWVTSDANSPVRIADSCAAQGYEPQFVLPSSEEWHTETENLEGAIVGTVTFPYVYSGSPATQEFHETMERYAPGEQLGDAVSLGWTGAKLFERVATSIDGPITRESIYEGLWALEDETLGGLAPPLNFPRGEPAAPPQCWFVLELVNAEWTAPQGAETNCR